MSISSKLSKIWTIPLKDALVIIDSLSARKWAGSHGIESVIAYAGVIDKENNPNKLHGHNGYWIADADEHVCYITNGDPVWCDWSEDCANEIDLPWGDFLEVMTPHAI